MDTDSGAFRFTIGDGDDGHRLDAVIAGHLSQCSRTQAAGLIKAGLIRIDDQGVKPAYRVRSGEEIRGSLPAPESTDIRPEAIPLDILHKDEHIIVINKPAGMVVHPAPGHATGTLVHGLLYHFPHLFSVGGQFRPSIVHRLDKDTSGCLVVALNDESHQELSRQFKARTVYKEYLALVQGRIAETSGMISHPIGRHPVDRKKMAINGKGARPAQTQWQVVQWFSKATLIRLVLHTGRTHQIRVHLSAKGHPVVGDLVYGHGQRAGTLEVGANVRRTVSRQMLHARRLGVVHPATGKSVRFEAPTPADMVQLIGVLNHHSDVGSGP